VLYGVWVLGNDYRARSPLYGSYPPGYLDRLLALFPDRQKMLHVFSGSLPKSPDYVTCDIRPGSGADLVGSVYDIQALVGVGCLFDLVVADPPYLADDSKQYGTTPVDRRRVLAAVATVTAPGGYLAWLDTVWPMHRRTDWRTAGRIMVQRSTNQRVRALTLFERMDG
jgi:hypothetical protein